MSPIVSTLAGVAARGYGGLGASVGVAPSGAYDSIATTTLSTATASVTFSSIPQTYTHLQLRALVKNTVNYAWGANIQLNGATNYSRYHRFGEDTSSGSGVIVDSGTATGQTFFTYGATAATNIFGVAIVDILDYTNTNKYKTLRAFSGWDNNGGGVLFETSSLYATTSAVSSLVITPTSGNIATYTQFALYGIKG
jgi:hypothetical protein